MSRVTTATIVARNTGAIAIVDTKDVTFLSQFTWSQNPRGHLVRNDHGRVLMMHRVIAGRAGLSLCAYIDHKDGNKLNNTRTNLRPATNQQNQFNTKRQANNTSGFKGVTWDKHNKRWLARIRFGKGNRKHLGSFATAQEAARAYNNAAEELHGEYARLNNV